MDYSQLASQEQIDRAMQALEHNGIKAFFVMTANEAKRKLFEIIPEGAKIMNMTSVTLETIGAIKEIKESGRYNPVRSAEPDWSVGSVHALTEDGKLMIASNTGSQLGAYAYGAQHAIWVIGAQKIVKDLDEGTRRIYEYVLPLENARARKAYGIDSNVSKILIINKEVAPDRATVIIVNEKLGF